MALPSAAAFWTPLLAITSRRACTTSRTRSNSSAVCTTGDLASPAANGLWPLGAGGGCHVVVPGAVRRDRLAEGECVCISVSMPMNRQCTTIAWEHTATTVVIPHAEEGRIASIQGLDA